MLPMLRWSSHGWRIFRCLDFRCRRRLIKKNSSVNDSVAIIPLAISQIPMSVEFRSVDPIVLSRQINSQQVSPILNDLQWVGAEQSTGLQLESTK